MMDKPTQPPRLFCTRLRMACIMHDVLGPLGHGSDPGRCHADDMRSSLKARLAQRATRGETYLIEGKWTRGWLSAGVVGRQADAPCSISRQSARLCMTETYCLAWSCNRRDPSRLCEWRGWKYFCK